MNRKAMRERNTKICKLYILGKKQQELAEQFDICRQRIISILQKNKITTRKAGCWAKKYEIDESIFEKIDCEWKAYFLGFMYADGNVQPYEAAIQLSEKDVNILETFSKLIYKTPRPLSYSKARSYKTKNKKRIFIKPAYRLRIINKKIVADLNRLGLIPKKSLILDFPTEKQVPHNLMRHFVRGYFDGDGCIQIQDRYVYRGKKKKLQKWHRNCLSIISSKLFISKLHSHLDAELKIETRIRNPKTLNTSTLVTDNKEYLKTIYDYFYKNATIFLTRKKDTFDKIKNI